MTKDLPVIGAAITMVDLPNYRPWLLEKQRDLELQDFALTSIIRGDIAGYAAHLKKHLDGYSGRLGLHGPFIGFTLDSGDPDIRDVVIKRLDQGLDACKALGAVQMVIHSPFTTWDHNNLDLKSNGRAKKIACVRKTLAQAIGRARDMGVTLVMENIQDIDPRDRLKLAAELGADVVKMSIDTGHAYYAHHVTGAPPVDQFVRDAGAQLAHVHLQDADGYADRHWGIGEGTICWPEVFRALGELDVKPHLVLELNDSGKIPSSMRYLETLGLVQ